MARDATARLYDVDEDELVFKKFKLTKKYDQGAIRFRARADNPIDLGKLHESVWATRLSGGTRSGVICLEITATGTVSDSGGELVLQVGDDRQQFELVDNVKAKPEDHKASKLSEFRSALKKGESVTLTGYVEGWVGRWPTVLREPPVKRPKLMVTGFEVAGG